MHLKNSGMWTRILATFLVVMSGAVFAQNTEVISSSSLPAHWTQALEASIPAPVETEGYSFQTLGFFVLGVALSFAVAWVASYFRKEEGVELRGYQPHFFWLPRKRD